MPLFYFLLIFQCLRWIDLAQRKILAKPNATNGYHNSHKGDHKPPKIDVCAIAEVVEPVGHHIPDNWNSYNKGDSHQPVIGFRK